MSKARFALRLCVALLLAQLAVSGTANAQQRAASQPQAETRPPEASYSPVADPKAMVAFGHARFTVLTPYLIRLEWAADGKFEDHASFVFLNRKLPVPKLDEKREGSRLTIDTGKLVLNYDSSSDDGKFTADNLSITFTLDGKQVT